MHRFGIWTWVAAMAFFVASPVVQAGVITWSPAANITGDSNVSDTGTVVGAFALGGGSVDSPTINGVAFTGVNAGGELSVSFGTGNDFTLTDDLGGGFAVDNTSSTSTPFTNLSTPYQELLSYAIGVSGPTNVTDFTLTMTGLTPYENYLFEWWNNNSTTTGAITNAIAGHTVGLNSNPSNAVGGVGQYATGTFTADATGTQTIAFDFIGPTFINGFELLDTGTSLPEPSSFALFGLGGFALVWRLRSRNR
jgi:hypothetical protein